MQWQFEHWAIFSGIVAILLCLDLFVFHKKDAEPTFKSSALWTVFWMALALSFNVLVWQWSDQARAIEFLTAYIVEWSLSMDNVFVFAVVFSYFGIPLKYQHRVLFWGILGAIILRLCFIVAGVELINRFDWVLPIFGLILIVSGVKLLYSDDDSVDLEQNKVIKVARRILPVSSQMDYQRFFTRESGVLKVTPLFLVLLVVETSDIMFAVDSVPAIFGVSRDPFIIYTSNIFAILGLRSLYFLLAKVIHSFHYLSHGLSVVLIFVGGKMIAEFFIPHEKGHHLVPPEISLLVIIGILTIAILVSLATRGRHEIGLNDKNNSTS